MHSFLHLSVGLLKRKGLCPINIFNRTHSKKESVNVYKESFVNLWLKAREFSNVDKVIVLLLATSGYDDLLRNFLCFTNSSTLHFKNFLIITTDQEVCDIANDMHVGCYKMERSISSDQNPNNFADFGSLSYQQLILYRTNITMQLLLMGFKPIIADIDTVWLSNPLKYLQQPFMMQEQQNGMDYYDLAVTDDNGEVCGCFVALHNSEAAILFWKELFDRHKELLRSAIAAGRLGSFSDSEQKLLTSMIYKGLYSKRAEIRVLPSRLFPS